MHLKSLPSRCSKRASLSAVEGPSSGWEKGVKDEVRNEKSAIERVGKHMLKLGQKGQLKEIVFSGSTADLHR